MAVGLLTYIGFSFVISGAGAPAARAVALMPPVPLQALLGPVPPGSVSPPGAPVPAPAGAPAAVQPVPVPPPVPPSEPAVPLGPPLSPEELFATAAPAGTAPGMPPRLRAPEPPITPRELHGRVA